MNAHDKDYNLIDDTDIDVIDMLNNTNDNAKAEFLSTDSLIAPNNRYDNLDAERVDRNISLLNERLDKGFGEEPDDQIIKRLIENNLHQNRFVQACNRYNSGDNTDGLIKEHQEENHYLYGDIDKDSFHAILSKEIRDIEEAGIPPQKEHVYKELINMLPSGYDSTCELHEPSKEIFVKFGNICKDYLKNILRYIPEQEIYSPQEVCYIANQIFENEFPDWGWKAIVKEGKGYASVNQETKTFSVPGRRSQGVYKYVDVRGIIAHEIGVHVLRGYPYRNCKLKALSMGVPGYIRFEEGLATAVQHTIEEKYAPVGHMHYVSIGLATFYHMNFRQVYEIQYRIHDLLGDSNKLRCFDSVQRTFRGTGQLVNNKDLAYFEGNKKVWKYIEENIDKESLIEDLWNVGKTDTTDIFWKKVAKYYS